MHKKLWIFSEKIGGENLYLVASNAHGAIVFCNFDRNFQKN